jgi:hypothetical protein
MKKRKPAVTERLRDWSAQYAAQLGQDRVTEAIRLAVDCEAAFDVTSDPGLEHISWSVPRAAVISATRFGDRPAFRPPTARPAEHAAHLLKQNGFENGVVLDYLEALLDGPILNRWELGKRLRACEHRAKEAAKAAGCQLLQGVTVESLKRQLAEAVELEVEMASYSSQLLRDDLVGTVRRRLEAFPRIIAGDFDELPPIVWLLTLHSLGGGIPLASGRSSKIEWPIEAIAQAQCCATALVSVPGWYPYWVAGPVPGQKPSLNTGA